MLRTSLSKEKEKDQKDNTLGIPENNYVEAED